ncbi:MAG: hypothetical protein EOM50_24715 [Erysipelotrichia bacterium]|nr:hypothetical protein [Erysipelotrichia bacterium]
MKTEELIKVKKYIEHVIVTIKHDGHLGTIQTDWILPDLEKALATIVGYECSSDTDKLSVEKLQEHLLPYKKETVQKIIDEKMQLVTADEFLKLHKESLTAIRENDELQEQLKIAKMALTSIKRRTERDELETYYVERNHDINKDVIDALAKINK